MVTVTCSRAPGPDPTSQHLPLGGRPSNPAATAVLWTCCSARLPVRPPAAELSLPVPRPVAVEGIFASSTLPLAAWYARKAAMSLSPGTECMLVQPGCSVEAQGLLYAVLELRSRTPPRGAVSCWRLRQRPGN